MEEMYVSLWSARALRIFIPLRKYQKRRFQSVCIRWLCRLYFKMSEDGEGEIWLPPVKDLYTLLYTFSQIFRRERFGNPSVYTVTAEETFDFSKRIMVPYHVHARLVTKNSKTGSTGAGIYPCRNPLRIQRKSRSGVPFWRALSSPLKSNPLSTITHPQEPKFYICSPMASHSLQMKQATLFACMTGIIYPYDWAMNQDTRNTRAYDFFWNLLKANMHYICSAVFLFNRNF